jgi:V/A-type H+-transporting ATPase subunit I
MIVPMKKVSLVILETDVRKALKALRNSGVLHLETVPKGLGADLESLAGIRDRIASSLSRLDASVKSGPMAGVFDREAADRNVDEIAGVSETLKSTYLQVGQISAQIEKLLPFGDFEPADLSILRAKGIDIRLYEGDGAAINSLAEIGASVFVLKKEKKRFLFAAAFLGDAPESAASRAVSLPEYGVSELTAMKEDLLLKVESLRGSLQDYSRGRSVLQHYLTVIEQEMAYEALATGISGEGTLTWLTGFVPEDRLDDIRLLASAEKWGFMVRDPEPDDPIPTLVKNNRQIRIIDPVFKFLGTLPGYREYDISLYFLAYFSVFFAMIVGDAGYGVIFFIAALILAVKSRKKSGNIPDILKLLFILSLATVAWGTVTGNWFGSKGIASLALLRSLTIPQISTYPELFPGVEADPQKAIMWLCFLLGLSQLTLANLMNFIRDFPALRSFTHIGWGSIIGGLYFLVLNLVIGVELPRFSSYMIFSGLALVVVFGEQRPGTGFLKGLAKGAGGAFTTFLNAISGFSNIVSYIRLFAVGMSSYYIATSFNSLASSMLSGWMIPFGILIIAVGHGLNLIMSVLSVVVHGIRLNMLEFSSQLGMEWTGIEYNPFRVRISEENNNQGVPS